MQYECKITVLETKCFPELQKQYLADPKSGPCPFFKPDDIPENDEEAAWLAKQNFKNTAEDAYMG